VRIEPVVEQLRELVRRIEASADSLTNDASDVQRATVESIVIASRLAMLLLNDVETETN
jgi:hypothetical protein